MSGGDVRSIDTDEDHGSETLDRYSYQDYLIAKLLPGALHPESQLEAILPEHIEDVCINETGLTRLIQVKTQKDSGPSWTLSRLISSGALGSLLRSLNTTAGQIHEEVEFGVWINGHISEGTARRPELLKVLVAHGEGGYLVSRDRCIENIQTEFDCTPDKAGALIKDLIDVVVDKVVHKGTDEKITPEQAQELISRTWVQAQPPLGAVRGSARKSLRELNMEISETDFDDHFARIMGRIKDAAAAAEGRTFETVGEQHPVRPDETDTGDPADRVVAAKELTRAEIIEILEPLVDASVEEAAPNPDTAPAPDPSISDGIRGLLRPLVSAGVLALVTFLVAQFTSVFADRKTWVDIASAALAVGGLAVGSLILVMKKVPPRRLVALSLAMLIPAGLLFLFGPRHISSMQRTDGRSIAVFALDGPDGELTSQLLVEELRNELPDKPTWVVWGPDELKSGGLDAQVSPDDIDDGYLLDRGIDIAIYGNTARARSNRSVDFSAWFGSTAVGVPQTGIGGEVELKNTSSPEPFPDIVSGLAPDITRWVAMLRGLSELHVAADKDALFRARDFFEEWRGSDDSEELTISESQKFRLGDFADIMIGTVNSFIVSSTPASQLPRGTSITNATADFGGLAESPNDEMAIRAQLGLAQVHVLDSPCAIDTDALADPEHPNHADAQLAQVLVESNGLERADADFTTAEASYQAALANGADPVDLPDIDFRLKSMKSAIEYCRWKATPTDTTQRTKALAAINAVIDEYNARSERDQLRVEFSTAASYGLRGTMNDDNGDIAVAACTAHRFLRSLWADALRELNMKAICNPAQAPSVEALVTGG